MPITATRRERSISYVPRRRIPGRQPEMGRVTGSLRIIEPRNAHDLYGGGLQHAALDGDFRLTHADADLFDAVARPVGGDAGGDLLGERFDQVLAGAFEGFLGEAVDVGVVDRVVHVIGAAGGAEVTCDLNVYGEALAERFFGGVDAVLA